MPKIDPMAAPCRDGTAYPAPYDQPCLKRRRTKLGDAAGLNQFGVSRLELEPGVWSAQRHWHSAEDESVWVVEGEVVLIDDSGEVVMRAGDCAGFPAGDGNGHHIVNRSDRLAVLLEVGSRRPTEDGVDYPDIDLMIEAGDPRYRHNDGTLYTEADGSKT